MSKMTANQARTLLTDWAFWARPKQLPPDGDWATWVIRAGRGFGKTRAGAGWIITRAEEYPGRWIALVARTPADARDYMVEGPSGILKTSRLDFQPEYEPSKRRITWPNGSWATIYSDEEPDQLRGFSGDTAWLDELAKFRNARASWDNLQFGMREASGDRPRRLITSTPRPLKLLHEIEALAGTVTVIGSSHENRSNLDPTWYRETISQYEGTRFGRQEIYAEILEEAEGALWHRSQIDELRVQDYPDMKRVVVSIDPAVTSNEQSDETGMIVAGLGADGLGYVLEDLSGRYKPAQWAERALLAYHRWSADRIVAEVNNGGDMVEHTIRTQANGDNFGFKKEHASRGKQARAEPVAALYEQKKVRHVGGFDELEDQMVSWEPLGTERSPDRVDALVWAFTNLMLGRTIHGPRVRSFS